MLRIGLCVYLMFATLLGPWLCCCRLPRLGARFAALLRSEKAESAESAPPCCQHRRPVKDSRQPAKRPNDPRCPCQGKRPEAPALVGLEADGARQLDRDNAQSVHLLNGDFLPTAVTPSFHVRLFSSIHSAPVHSGRDILSALHILRC